jgi:hypothetical protein
MVAIAWPASKITSVAIAASLPRRVHTVLDIHARFAKIS